MFDLAKLGHGHGLQHSQRFHSMANNNLCKNHMTHVCTVSEKITFKICDLEIWGQCRRVQYSQWSHLMENINLYKVVIEHFSQLTVFKILTFQNSWPLKYRPKVKMYNLALAPFDSKYLTSHLMVIWIVCIFQSLIVKIAIWKVWPCQFRSRSRSTAFAMVSFDGKYQLQ